PACSVADNKSAACFPRPEKRSASIQKQEDVGGNVQSLPYPALILILSGARAFFIPNNAARLSIRKRGVRSRPYAHAEQRKEASASNQHFGKSPCGLARAKFESSGEGTFSRFGNGARGTGGGLDPNGTGGLRCPVLSRRGAVGR